MHLHSHNSPKNTIRFQFRVTPVQIHLPPSPPPPPLLLQLHTNNFLSKTHPKRKILIYSNPYDTEVHNMNNTRKRNNPFFSLSLDNGKVKSKRPDQIESKITYRKNFFGISISAYYGKHVCAI